MTADSVQSPAFWLRLGVSCRTLLLEIWATEARAKEGAAIPYLRALFEGLLSMAPSLDFPLMVPRRGFAP